MDHAVRRAGPDDTAAIGAMLGRAFADDPVQRYLSPRLDDAERAVALGPFFAALTRSTLRLAGVWTTADHTGATIWAPPGQRLRTRDELPAGIAFLRMAWRSVPRGVRLTEAMRRARPKGPPHWYLEVLGTDPEHQGRGIGTALFAPVLDRCDAEGVPAYLESSKPGNVGYYERFGFRVLGEIAAGPGGPPLWTMWRDP